MNWQPSKVLSLIELYKTSRVLWDSKNADYYKKNVKDEAWTLIGSVIDEPVDTCKSKIMSLLASYRREKGKVRQSSTSTGVSYKSRWFAYEALKFLEERDITKKKDNDNAAPEVDDQGSNSHMPDDLLTDGDLQLVKSEPWFETEDEEIVVSESSENRASVPVDTRKRKRAKRDDGSVEDECYHFGQFIASKLRSYETSTRCAIQTDIMHIFQGADSGNV